LCEYYLANSEYAFHANPETVIIDITPTGRATVLCLKINHPNY